MSNPSPLRLAFVDMWSNFDPEYNFITALLRIVIRGGVEITTPADCDTLIYGPRQFGNQNQKYKDKFRIHYTGENTRPPLADANFCISFDFDARNYGNITSTNYRLPLWWFFINWVGLQMPPDSPDWYWGIPPSYLDQPNEFTQTPKTKFCATVFRNFAAYRRDTLRAFADKYKPIDAYGGNNPLRIVPDVYSKLTTLAHYKFSMCYENSSYPGYVTEKLLHAKVANTVPIYWGNRTFAEDFNPECCVFFDGDYDKLIAEVRRLDEDDDAYAEMLARPLFRRLPNINTGAWVFFDIFQRRFGLDKK